MTRIDVTKLATWALGAFLGMGGCTMGHAQPTQCGPHADIVSVLAKKYHEHPAWIGLNKDGHLMQLFVSKATWTLISISPTPGDEKMACIVGAGDAPMTVKPVVGRPA